MKYSFTITAINLFAADTGISNPCLSSKVNDSRKKMPVADLRMRQENSPFVAEFKEKQMREKEREPSFYSSMGKWKSTAEKDARAQVTFKCFLPQIQILDFKRSDSKESPRGIFYS